MWYCGGERPCAASACRSESSSVFPLDVSIGELMSEVVIEHGLPVNSARVISSVYSAYQVRALIPFW